MYTIGAERPGFVKEVVDGFLGGRRWGVFARGVATRVCDRPCGGKLFLSAAVVWTSLVLFRDVSSMRRIEGDGGTQNYIARLRRNHRRASRP